ncbi:hypothetical protein I7I50_01123 [Histoplasma capsulatum G186AR]|uniref:Uncharacterized protein n=1 Tax=Ajellomyces capsulatus TaxID=5037 RepID=A0A8H7YXI9_AJECA|nr:hypothetical protein I7I52_09054 [Histoplasma capsulatum]QSS73090.1 hypothetical protein I7I50_01123 [Histoplasma capsulatum G186AR]
MIFRVFYAFLRDSQDLIARVVWFNTPWLGHILNRTSPRRRECSYTILSLTEARVFEAHCFLCGEWEQVVPPPAEHPVR